MEIYEEYLKKYPNLGNGEIADLIIEQENINIKRKSVLRGLQRVRNSSPKIVGSGYKGDSYEIGVHEYEFNFGGVEFDIPKDQIAAACAWYVDPNGLTLSQVANKLWTFYKRDVDENFLKRILKCLGITKSSNGLAPHIVSEWDDEQVSEFFLKMRREKVEQKITEDTQYKALYEDERRKTLNAEKFLRRIRSEIQTGDLPEWDFPKDLPISMDRDLVLILSDWHVGQKSGAYNKDVYQERVENLCSQIAGYFMTSIKPVNNLHVLILGDMLDGPMSNMRPEQALEQDLYHEQQVLYASRGIARVIDVASSKINGNVTVEAIGGNHGRVGPSRKDDPTRFGDKMSYVLAEEMSQTEAEWKLHSGVVGSFMCRSTQILFLHGDRGSGKPKDLVWANRNDQAKKFVVCSGHLHAVKAEEVDRDIYAFRGGCLCGTDDHAASLGYGNRAAQVMFEVYDDGPRMPIYLPVD